MASHFRFASLALTVATALCAPSALAASGGGATTTSTDNSAEPPAPPPVVQGEPAAPPPVVAMQPAPAPQPVPVEEERHHFLFAGIEAGPSFPLVERYFYGAGVWGNIAAGIALDSGLSFALTLGVRDYFGSTGYNNDAWNVGVRGRYALLQRRRVHPFVQVGIDLFNIGFTGDLDTFGVNGGVGFELDLTRHLSAEIGARAEAVFTNSLTSGGNALDFVFTPFVGVHYYR